MEQTSCIAQSGWDLLGELGWAENPFGRMGLLVGSAPSAKTLDQQRRQEKEEEVQQEKF